MNVVSTYIAFSTLSLLGFLNTSAWSMWIKELLGYVVHEVAATDLLSWSQRFFFLFFFRERESEPRSGDNEENISELWKTETRVGSEGLQ